ncbi:peptide chain release factor N(5)-glutamine methyltransferase [Oceanicoccus sp. KOV_DT_Chl]|uniref:peptide chain release factor N(5)-glutamine methyltransferase n=1 Tax=Oceanicoccus sp. KOV_DT_Chl TaxID=1904639 RepID=UPI000C797DB8|nr:peptide chain release factor N(5)-glutamine methyltransferase [Oceanicoccus sp. KOV_DT_Chl]
MATVAQLLAMRQQLTAISDTAAVDVELLLCHCLQKPRSYLRTWPEAEVADTQQQQFQQLLQRRQQGEPVAHLIGERGFWTLDLQVNPSTLIPRPETELLVEKILQLFAADTTTELLDLGTGTGAIALSIASERPQWKIAACDIQPAAVALAETNRQCTGLENVCIFQSNWFDQVQVRQFNVIVSNPPYIDVNDENLNVGDVRFEPLSALVADNKGLADLEMIIQQAPDYLARDGWLLVEHGYQQGPAVSNLLLSRGFTEVFTDQDLAGHDRISGGQWWRG